MKIFWGVLICLVFLCSSLSIPQTDTTGVQIDDLLENISPSEEIETVENDNYDFLEELSRSPVDINTADLYELQRIPFIDYNTAQKIILHRSIYGRYFSKTELYTIDGVSADIVKQVLNFVTVDIHPIVTQKPPQIEPPGSFVHLNFRSRVINNLKNNFAENKYSGNSLKLYNKLNFQNSFASVGIIAEKDPGEIKINDFNSLYLNLTKLSFIDNLVLGDYNLKVGQGLIAAGPYGVMKSSEAIIPVKKGKGIIIPYKSVQENLFFRGVAIQLNLSFLDLLFFYSRKQIDAVIDSSGNINSVSMDGYHRTQTEIAKRNNARETCFGSGINYYYKELLHIQLVHFRSLFSHSRIVDDTPKKGFSFTSVSYDITFTKMNVYGETGYDENSAATINYFFFPVSKEVKFINCIRWYPGFISFYGNSFAERSSIYKNETGFYSGLNYKSPVGDFNVFFDQFNLGNSGLSLQGNEWFVSHRIKINKAEIITSCRNKSKENIKSENKINKELRRNYTLELRLSVNSRLRTRIRLQYKQSSDQLTEEQSEGYLFFYDMLYHFTSLQLYGRVILFDTDDFDSAVYEYENNLTGIFQNLALYETGLRWYLLIKYVIIDEFNISIKYGETYKTENNIDNQIGIQTEFTF